jgi:hypothetical protein
MGWFALRHFVKCTKEEDAALTAGGPLTFAMLRKIARALRNMEQGLNDIYFDAGAVDRTSATFGKVFGGTTPYKFGHLTPKIHKFKDGGTAWLDAMAQFEKENPAKYREMTEMFQWLLRPEAGPTPGGRKANFRIKFKLRQGGPFNPVVEKLEHNPQPTHEKRKYHVDLSVDFD